MFTGLVTAIGQVRAPRRGDERARAHDRRCPYEGLVPGESIAVDGACLTVSRWRRASS